MGQFAIRISGSGVHGCDRKAAPGDKLFSRCRRLDCVDCLTLDFVQNLRQKGFVLSNAEFVHHAGAVDKDVVITDNLLSNTRQNGKF